MSGHAKTPWDDPAVARLGLGETQVCEALGPRYEVLSFVGAGASALVLKAADLAADREVRALKLTSLTQAGQGADPAAAARAEFAFASRFAHPNLVRYFDLDIPPEAPFALTAMEFVDGVPFGPALTQRDVNAACELVVQLLRGLQFLHDAGFVHGDVKPSNVLGGLSGGRPWAKLLDFHLALRAADTADARPRGTLRYMAPEVIAGRPPETRSDLYSAGVLFYEALTGDVLFDGVPADVAMQHLAAPIALAERAGELGRVLERLLSKSPEGRYESASETIAALAAVAGEDWLAETPETLLGRVRSVPLVGRGQALASFDGLLQPPRSPTPSAKVFAVRGRPGLGKTRLLDACKVQAQCAGLSVLSVGHTEAAAVLLDKVGRWAGLEDADQSPAPTGDAGRELRSHAGSVPDQMSGMQEGGQSALPAALMSRCNDITDRLLELGVRRRVGLFFDDVDSLPSDALECVLFLMRGTMRSPVVFGLAMSDAPEERDSLHLALATWQQDGLLTEAPLEELSQDDRRCLIQKALPGATPPAVIDALAEGSGGLPGTIVLTLGHLIATRRLAADVGGRMLASEDLVASLPAELAELGTEFLAAARASAREALELLAAAREEVDADVLAVAAGVARGSLLDTLEHGPASALASVRRTDRAVLCKLQHPHLGDALLEPVPPQRAKALHDRLADAIEQVHGPATGRAATSISKHRLQGKSAQRGVRLVIELLADGSGKGADESYLELAKAALRHAKGADRTCLLEMAGDLTCARGAFSEAVELFAKALRGRRLAESHRLRLLRKLGSAYAESGAYPKARRTLGRALAILRGTEAPDTVEMAGIKLLLARTDFHESKYPSALENYESARRLGAELGDEHLVATALLGLGATYLEQREFRRSYGALLRAVRRFHRIGDPAGAAIGQAMLGYLAMVDQHWQRSVGFLQEAIPPLKEAGHLVEAARALGNLGALNQKLCAWEEAKEHYTLALATHERLGHGRGQSTVLMNLSQLNTSLGWLELAIAQAERALQVAPSDPRLRCLAMNRLARAYYALGDLRRAHETSSSAAEMAAPLDLYVPLESAHRTLGEIEGLQGNWAASCKQFQSALAICQRSGSTEREVVCTARLAEVTLASGDPARGLMLADSACRTAGRLPQGGVRALARTVRGKALLAGGRPAEALTDLLEADRFLDKARVWDEAAEVSLELAKAHLQLGRLRFATLHCRAALETVEQVARRLQSEEHRYLFTHDPRRAELYETAAALRRAAERSTGDPTGEDQGGD